MQSETINVDDLSVQVIRSRRKTLSLEINHDGIKARAPLRMSTASISQFVQQKRSWINKHLHHVPMPLEPLQLIDGAALLLEGEPLSLKLRINASGSPIIDTALNERRLLLPIKVSHLDIQTSAKNKLIKWYKKKAIERLEQRREFYSPRMAVPSHLNQAIKVREYKRRWGSCDAAGALSFNWRIIMAPPEVLDYLVVHELAHCHEFNHSRKFWAIVETQLPTWRERQAWLQKNGVQLYRF